MTILKSPPHAPNGIYTRAGAQYKVYESIWNITRPLLHIRHTRQHVDFFRPPSRGAANHAVDAATVLGRTAVPSCALGRCVWTARPTQGSSHQACASPAYNPNAGCWQIEQMQAMAAHTPPCDQIAAAEPQHARRCSSRPRHAAQRWSASSRCAPAAVALSWTM